MKIGDVFVYLCVSDAAAAIEFYKRASGVKEKLCLTEPSGCIGRVELDSGPMMVMHQR